VVVDPFAGSGTTSVVARRLGRRAGGLELHREFAEEAQRRLAEAERLPAQPELLDEGREATG
jgi:DNA modification methylase